MVDEANVGLMKCWSILSISSYRLQWFLLMSITLLQRIPNTSLCPANCLCHSHHEPATSISDASLIYLVSCDHLGLKSFPENIERNVTHLSLSGNHISSLDQEVLGRLRNLEILDLSSNRISEISEKHFSDLSSLRELILTDNPIMKIPVGAFDHLTSLHNLHLSETFLEAVPVFTVPSPVVHLHLDHTNIQQFTPDSLRHYSNLEGLYLKRSKIKRLVNGVFKHARKLKYLLMEYSSLDYIEVEAFHGVRLHTLSLQGTRIHSLPVSGLEELINLNLEDVYSLWELHASQLPNIRHLLLTYEFLCCPFVDHLFDDTWEVGRHEQGVLQECKHTTSTELPLTFPRKAIIPSFKSSEPYTNFPTEHSTSKRRFNHTTSSSRSALTTSPPEQGIPTNQTIPSTHPNRKSQTTMPIKFATKFSRTTPMGEQNDFVSLTYNGSVLVFTLDPCDLGPFPSGNVETPQLRKKRVICRPIPDEFNPCEDLLGTLALRVCTWLVSVCATTGNLVTLVVILLNRRKVDNHKLLMCTLAFSSLCMGVYLIILAAVDTGTRGYYNKYAKQWQHGVGCKLAGFLSIFSTELSVFTLSTITVERYYTIMFPLRQVKWMTVRQTAISLVLSFLAALVLAALPLTGISSYTKVAICLPFDVSSPSSKAYVTFLLASNGASFFAVLFAYIKMYLNIKRTARTSFSDLNIAKKMAVIVLTNFACWAPVALFSLIAVYGAPLIDLPMSKFLLVFVFPINAFTNPFLYFLITKRFQQDLLAVLNRCRVCACCAGSSYIGRERTSSVLVRTASTRSRTRSSSGNSLITIFRRTPGANTSDTQSSTTRISLHGGCKDRFGSVLVYLPPNSRRGSELAGAKMFNPQSERRKSYVMTANNNLLPANIDDNMASKYLLSNGPAQSSSEDFSDFISESAC